MKTQIDDLVAMHDSDTLYEIMTDSDDEVLQVDAAEGLIKLGDPRGLKFLLSAENSENKHLRKFAEELLDSSEMKDLRAQIEAQAVQDHLSRLGKAKIRLQKGQTVFRYKAIFIPSADLLQEDLRGGGVDLPDLTEAGLEGWEVVGLIPRRQLVVGLDDQFTGAYALLKKGLTPEESAELDDA